MLAKPRRVVIAYFVSDSSGMTAEHLIRSELELHEGVELDPRWYPRVEHPDELAPIYEHAKREGAVILYSFADPRMCAEAGKLASQLHVPAVFVMHAVRELLRGHLGREPARRAVHTDNTATLRRQEAIEFLEEHEDGKNPEGLVRAQIVLIGLSRVTKTPVCQTLAWRGFFTGNIPLVLQVPPDPVLFKLERERVFVLTMKAIDLLKRRKKRADIRKMGDTNYTDMPNIRKEMDMVAQLLKDNPGWTEIDVTAQAAEETAARISQYYHQRFPRDALVSAH